MRGGGRRLRLSRDLARPRGGQRIALRRRLCDRPWRSEFRGSARRQGSAGRGARGPGVSRAGHCSRKRDMTATHTLQKHLEDGVSQGTFPSAQAVVLVNGEPAFEGAAGTADLKTVFDLASQAGSPLTRTTAWAL